MKRRALVLSLALLATCAPQGFKPSSFVDTLRVLAVQADKPLAAPGEDVNLRALVVDPLGAGRPLRLWFATCTNPGSAEVVACAASLGPAEQTPIPADGEPTFSVHVPEDALAAGDVGSVGVVFAACAGTLSVAARPEGAPVGCVDAKGARVGREGFVWGEKRITVVRGARNANPEVANVYFDGHRWDEGFDIALDACAGTRVDDCSADRQHEVDVQVPRGTAEAWLGGTEDVVTFFHVSQGAVHDDVARAGADGVLFPNLYAPAGAVAARPIDVWVVVRDDRGGVGWAHRTATLR